MRSPRWWMGQALIVKRWNVIALGALIGFLFAGFIFAVSESILTRSDVRSVAERTARLEAPTDREVIDQITKRLRTCLRQGGCRQTIRTTLNRVLRYARIASGPRGLRGRTGPRGPAGKTVGRGPTGLRGPTGPAGADGAKGRDAPAPEIVATPHDTDPRRDLDARLLQDVDTLISRLEGRVDRIDRTLRCVLANPVNVLRC